jgi:hypothetical protein
MMTEGSESWKMTVILIYVPEAATGRGSKSSQKKNHYVPFTNYNELYFFNRI